MNKLNINIGDSAEVEKLQTNEQAEPNEQPAELINNAMETSEDTNETTEEPKAETTEKKPEAETSNKVVIRYVGGGVWKDSKGDLWASVNKSNNILSERQYTKDEYEKRSDIKFMVRYGAMTETYVE